MPVTANNLTSYQSKDFRGQFSTYGPWPSFVVWTSSYDPSASKGPVIKVPLSLARCVRLKESLEKLLVTEGEVIFPFEVWFYNKETKTEEYEASIAVGRNATDICFIECCSARHKEKIRLPLNDDRCIRLDGGTKENANDMSVHGVKYLITLIDTLIPSLVSLGIADRNQAPEGEDSDGGTGHDVPF